MEESDLKQVTILLNSYLLKFATAPVFSVQEARQKFLPRENTIFSFVVEVRFLIFKSRIQKALKSLILLVSIVLMVWFSIILSIQR